MLAMRSSQQYVRVPRGEALRVNKATVVQTSLSDSCEAGSAIGQKILIDLANERPDVVIVFASAQHDYSVLLQAIEDTCHPDIQVGCSSAGEFTTDTRGTGEACALAIRTDSMQFSASLAQNLQSNRVEAASQLVNTFQGMTNHNFAFRSAMVLTDALAGHADDLLDHVNRLTGGTYKFFGGGAGDDARFQRTHVFLGTETFSDAAVALEILSHEPVGIGVAHGWRPASDPMRVTESDGMRLISLNSIPVLEVFQQHAIATGQTFNLDEPMPFFLHNVVGIEIAGGFKLRVPLFVDEKGAVLCAAEVPTGATVYLMNAGDWDPVDAASSATNSALSQVPPNQPKTVIFFDCAATRLRMGANFGVELDTIGELLRDSKYLGCNTYGQIARAEGQLSGFHNCTAVACVLPL